MQRHDTPGTAQAISDVRLAALALAAGAALDRVEESDDRLVFHVAGLPDGFRLQVLRGAIMVNARDVLAHLDAVMGLVAGFKQRRAREQRGRR
jgi:hypothetical protein